MTTGATGQREQGGGGSSAWGSVWFAWLLCAVSLAILASVLVAVLLGWSTSLPRGYLPWREQAISLMGIIGAPIVGGLVASRRPRNPYGWLWLGFGLGLSLGLLAESYAAYALVVEPGSLLAPRETSRLLAVGNPMALAFAPFLFLLFPTGRLPSRRWRPVAWTAGTSGVVLVDLNLYFARPDFVGGAVTAVTFAVVLAIFAAIVLSALSLVARYRRSSGVERQQLKWFALAAVLAATYIVGTLLGLERILGGTLWHLAEATTNMSIYAAVGIAILRYRLYDIDVLINRTLVYGSLTVSLVAVYLGGIVVLQFALRALTGQESTLAVVASTLAIAALFNPLRRRIQSFIDRRFYRSKYDAAKTLEAFNSRLRDETELDTLSSDVIGVVRETMQPEHASLWLRSEAPYSGEREA